jgi:hypothetical protein
LELPSGQEILARRPDAAQLAVWGRLPLQLAAAAMTGGETPEFTVEDGVELMTFYRELLNYCCVEPRISLAPAGDDEIHPKDIPQEDWQYILRWAMRFEEGRKFEGFRRERAGSGVGGDGEVVGGPAVGVVGDDGPGVGLEV